MVPSRPARRLWWHVLSLADRTLVRRFVVAPIGKPGAVIGWIEGGAAEIELESGRFTLHPGPFLHVVSMQWPRAYRPLTDRPYRHLTVRFAGPHLDAWIEEMGIARNPEFGFAPSDPALDIRNRLAAVARRRAGDWERSIHLLLSDLLSRLVVLRCGVDAADRLRPDPVSRVLDAIEADPDRDWKTSELPPLAGVSYSLLRKLFRAELGESMHAFLQRSRIDRARLLLAEGTLSIKEIALRLHFGNEYSFSNCFKAKTSFNPTRFREQSDCRSSQNSARRR